MTDTHTPKIPLLLCFIPILILIILLGMNVLLFGDSATSGPNQIALIASGVLAAVIGVLYKVSWDDLHSGVIASINTAMPAILILLIIGALSGTWLLSGIVPAMIYYGLMILNAKLFLVAACAICAIVSVATGSSWSTAATVGIALMGIGTALGINTAMVAGAIISGAYFGDKMSPLSDTTNLAPAMAHTDVFSHVRYMLYTTVPTFSITLIIFLVLGFFQETHGNTEGVQILMTEIKNQFNVTPVLFLVPLAVLALILKKVNALTALFVGTALGAIFAVIFQPDIVKQASGINGNYLKQAYKAVIFSLTTNVDLSGGNANLADLLSSSGMAGMLNTIWLILSAMVFGGFMEATGMLTRITELLMKLAKSTGSLIATTAASCVFFNLTASDQYLAIVVPGKMFAPLYKKMKLKGTNLSRTLEDSGTVTSALVPWNTCGAYMSQTLGVATFAYLPYCFFNYLSPIMTVFVGAMGFKIAYEPDAETKNKEEAMPSA